MKRSAIISPCGLYRYRLDREWGPNPDNRLVWVMLNPSTADGEQDDPTIRRCIAFSKREGYDALCVVNLFAYRATEPANLLATVALDTPLSDDDSDRHTQDAINDKVCVAAWGAWEGRGIVAARGRIVRMQTRAERWMCLGHTKDGNPRHPLYVRGDQPFEPFGDIGGGA